MRVLVVEDEADLRMLMRIHLERAGHDVEEASDGLVALEALGDGTLPDLVLLDIRMPRADGWQVLEALRGQGRLPGLPVIVVSAFTSADVQQKAIAMGGRAYLSKPFGRPELMQVIEEIFGKAS
ncbi:MAG: response regulator [Acidimicrobiales bacterium]